MINRWLILKMETTAGGVLFAKRLSWLVVDRVRSDYRNWTHRKVGQAPRGQEICVQA